MEIQVIQFARKPYPGAFSIERVFRDINLGLPDDIAVRGVENAFYSNGLWPRLSDAWRARQSRGAVNHVLGDVHYLTFFLPRARTILTIHDCEMIERARGLKRWLLKLFWLDLPMRRAGHVVAISQQTKASILRLSRIAPARIHVIDNPVSDQFRAAPGARPHRNGPPRILHIGTKANKNLSRLVQALQGLDVTLTVVGPLSAAQRAQLDRSGIAYDARCDLSDAEIRDCYAQADLLAFVSLSEGFGVPILEAQAMGVPIVTANRAPMCDVAGPGGAVLVDPEDIGAIRAGVTQVLEDAAARAALITAGQSNAARYRPQTIAAQYAQLYRSVAQA